MSTITGPGAVGPTLPLGALDDPDVSPSTTPTTPDAPPPLFSNRFTGLSTAVALGLARPAGNLGDFEAVFAEIAARLKDSEAASRDAGGIAQSESRRTELTRVSAFIAKMLALGGIIDSNESNIRNKTARIKQIDTELTPLRATRDALNAQKSGVNSQISALNTQISGQQGVLNGLIGVRDGLVTQYNAATTDSERAALLTQINQVNSDINSVSQTIATLNGAVSNLVSVRNGIDAQLNTVNAQINTLEAERAAAETSINNSRNAIANAIGTMVQLIVLGLPLLIGVLLGSSAAAAREAGHVTKNVDAYEDTLLGVLREHESKFEDRVDLRFMEENATRGLGSQGSEQTGGLASRFGGISPAQTRAVGFAAVIAALNGALSGLNGDDLSRSAGAMAQAGSGRSRVAV